MPKGENTVANCEIINYKIKKRRKDKFKLLADMTVKSLLGLVNKR